MSELNYCGSINNKFTAAPTELEIPAKKPGHRIWYDNPKILFNDDEWLRFIPTSGMDNTEVMNAVFRFSVYFFIISFAITRRPQSIMIPIVVAIITWFINKSTLSEKYNDSFADRPAHPTRENPFMNTLLSELGEGEKREAPSVLDEKTKKEIEYLFNLGLYKDADDLYNHRNSQNRFYTVPNTNEYGVSHGNTVKFANWLYNSPRKTCKENAYSCTNSSYSKFVDQPVHQSNAHLLVPGEQSFCNGCNKSYRGGCGCAPWTIM